MSLNPKAVRRLTILLMIVLVAASAATGAWFYGRHRINARHQAARARGLAAYQRGDYVAALPDLAAYIAKSDGDTEALFAYSMARLRVELPDGEHVADALKRLRLLQHMDPENLEVRRALLELFVQVHYTAEAIEAADFVLLRVPDDPRALRAKAAALEQANRLPEALAIYERLNQVDLSDLESQLATYRLYQRTHKSPRDVLARAQAMRQSHPGEPRFVLLLALAHDLSGDQAQARKLLEEAGSSAWSDPKLAIALTAWLDRAGLYGKAQALLEKTVAETRDAEALAVLIQRLWQRDAHAEVVRRLEGMSIDTADTRLLALQAMSLRALDRNDDATKLLTVLRSRQADRAARAWTTALEVLSADPPLEPRASVEAYQAALKKDPDNGVIRYLLGLAYEQMGETEPAIEAWAQAARRSPSWSKPPDRIARALMATGRADEAVEAALRAVATAPEDVRPTITLVLASWARLADQPPDQAADTKLLQAVQAVQSIVPLEPQTLPVQLALLARTGQRDAAIDLLRSCLGDDALDADVLPSLTSMSRAYGLGLQEQVLARMQQPAPTTPQRIWALAAELAAQGRGAEGLALVQSATPEQAAAAKPHWDLALARYLELIGDPAAAATWMRLAEAYPNDVQVQTSLLRSASALHIDRQFWDRSIERVRELTGDAGLLWRLERARWLLESDEAKGHSDAVNTLTDIVRASPTLIEPRLLLAAALEKVGNTGGAIRELQVAAGQRPRSAAILLELARLAQSAGRTDEAQSTLDRLAKLDRLDPAMARQVAKALAGQGQTEQAIILLQTTASHGVLDPENQLLLGGLMHRAGRSDDAAAIYARLLDRPVVEANTLASAAEFYASIGEAERAWTVLGRLSELDLRPGMRELTRARFCEKHRSIDSALSEYTAATIAGPADPATWRALAEFRARRGQLDEALAALDAGLANTPNNQVLQGLKSLTQIALSLPADDRGDDQALVDALSDEATIAETAALLQLLQDAHATPLSQEQMIERLGDLLERFPKSRAINAEMMRRYVAADRTIEAIEVAQRAMVALPDDAAIAATTTALLRSQKRWPEMERAARQWRQRSSARPMHADLALAEARLAQNDPAETSRLVDAYLPHVQANPEGDPAATAQIARILAATDRDGVARSVLEPLLPREASWRGVWMAISSGILPVETASDWLAQVGDLIPADAPEERLRLAAAWHDLGQRTGSADAMARARDLLLPLTASDDAPASSVLLLAYTMTWLGENDAAEQAYRRAIALDPAQPQALNNLAYLMVRRSGSDTVETERLARRAVELSPATPAFYDTLGRALLRQERHEQALSSFEKALELDPAYAEALAGKGLALAWLGREREAMEVLRKLETTRPTGGPMPPTISEDLELLRSRLSTAVDTR